MTLDEIFARYKCLKYASLQSRTLLESMIMYSPFWSINFDMILSLKGTSMDKVGGRDI